MLYRDDNKIKFISIDDYVKTLESRYTLKVIRKKGIEQLQVKPVPRDEDFKLITMFRDEILKVLKASKGQPVQPVEHVKPVKPVEPVEPLSLEPLSLEPVEPSQPIEFFSRDDYNREHFNIEPVYHKPYDPMNDVNRVAPWLVIHSRYKDDQALGPRLLSKEDDNSLAFKRFLFAEAVGKIRRV